jgi:hypothetical protein
MGIAYLGKRLNSKRMNRREILKYVAFATGAAISTPLITSILSGCNAPVTKNEEEYVLHFFSPAEFSELKALIDLILPRTDSPSAMEVGVHQIIDTMVGTVYKEEEKAVYRKKFDALMAHLNQGSGEKLSLLQNLEQSKNGDLENVREAYFDLKQQTIAYYLSTEEIGKNYLHYLPIPGTYEACISLEEVGGKAWAI